MKDERLVKKISDKETRRLQKTRTTTAKMGGLSEDRPKKGRGRRKVDRKGQQQTAYHNILNMFLGSPIDCYSYMKVPAMPLDAHYL